MQNRDVLSAAIGAAVALFFASWRDIQRRRFLDEARRIRRALDRIVAILRERKVDE